MPPQDFSFCNLETVEDITDAAEARKKAEEAAPPKKTDLVRQAYSTLLARIPDLLCTQQDLRMSKGLRLTNNSLSSLTGLPSVLGNVVPAARHRRCTACNLTPLPTVCERRRHNGRSVGPAVAGRVFQPN
jgi:hypothetical protein